MDHFTGDTKFQRSQWLQIPTIKSLVKHAHLFQFSIFSSKIWWNCKNICFSIHQPSTKANMNLWFHLFFNMFFLFFFLPKKTEWFWIIEWQTLSEWNQWKLQQFFCHEMLSKSWQWNRHNGSCLMRRSDISIAVLWHRMNKYLLK